MSDVQLKITAQLDMSKAESQLNSLKDKNTKITTDADDALNDIKSVKQGLKSIKDTKVKINADASSGSGTSKAGGMTGQLVGNTKQGLKEYNMLLSDIKTAEGKALKATNPGMAKFYKQQASEMRGVLGEVYSNGIADLTPAQRASLQQSIDVNEKRIATMKSEASAKAQAKVQADIIKQQESAQKEYLKVQSKASNIYDKYDSGILDVDLERMQRQSRAIQKAIYPDNMPEYANKYKKKYLEDMKDLEVARKNLGDARKSNDPRYMVDAMSDYDKVSKRATASLKGFNDTKKDFIDSERFGYQKDSMALDIDKYTKDYSAARKRYGADLEQIKQGMLGSVDSSEFQMYQDQFRLLDKQIAASGMKRMTLFDSVKSKIGDVGKYMVGAFAGTAIVGGMKSMYDNVAKIDSAMTELKKVTDETPQTYKKFTQEAGRQAAAMGSTVSDYISSTASFSRLGYNFDEAKNLAKVASMYSLVGDEVGGIDNASKSLISTMTAFKVPAKDAIKISDSFNEVGFDKVADIA